MHLADVDLAHDGRRAHVHPVAVQRGELLHGAGLDVPEPDFSLRLKVSFRPVSHGAIAPLSQSFPLQLPSRQTRRVGGALFQNLIQ